MGLNDTSDLKNIFKEFFHLFFIKEIQRMSCDSFSNDLIKDLSSHLATLAYNVEHTNIYQSVYENILNFVVKFNIVSLINFY